MVCPKCKSSALYWARTVYEKRYDVHRWFTTYCCEKCNFVIEFPSTRMGKDEISLFCDYCFAIAQHKDLPLQFHEELMVWLAPLLCQRCGSLSFWDFCDTDAFGGKDEKS